MGMLLCGVHDLRKSLRGPDDTDGRGVEELADPAERARRGGGRLWRGEAGQAVEGQDEVRRECEGIDFELPDHKGGIGAGRRGEVAGGDEGGEALEELLVPDDALPPVG